MIKPLSLVLSTMAFSNQPSSMTTENLRSDLFKLLQEQSVNSPKDIQGVRTEFENLLRDYKEAPGSQYPNDVLFAIGKSIFGINLDKAVKKNYNQTVAGSNCTTKPAAKAEPVEEEGMIVEFDYVKGFMKDVFMSYGVPEDRAEICSDVLSESDRRGIDSHGLGRLKPIYCDRMDQKILKPTAPIDVLRETDTTAMLDGNMGLGLYIGPYCMNLAIQKAKKHGVGFVVVRNSTHYGIAGYYATMATEQGCIGWTGTNARPSQAPTFGVEPMLGTNPLTFGIPTKHPQGDDFDFVIDCATSINQRGKLEVYAREGKDTPKGVVIDQNGIERTDTEGILEELVMGTCALNPMGGAGDRLAGYKGYSWALVVELLSTAFQLGPFGEDVCGVDRATGKKKPMPLGHYFLAIDIEALCPLEEFKIHANKLLSAIRASKKSPLGPGRIWTAGEPEYDERKAREAQGGMVVSKVLQKTMEELRAKRPGLAKKYAKFPWEK